MHQNLQKCKLCNEKPADQTGSHIFSFFLIKGAFNEKGELKRDKEVLFGISPIRLIETYFGRSINSEKIEELKGRVLTDKEIENNKNPFTIDYLVCRYCEKRFGTIEAYFKDKVYDKLITNNFKEETDKKGTKLKVCDSADNRLIRLFIYLNIWRAAAAKYNDWKIKPKEQEDLRQILNKHLSLKQVETIKLVEISNTRFSHFPMIVTYIETEAGNETENTILIDNSIMPYCLILNDIVVQFYVKNSHAKGSINWVYGISDMINKKEHLNFYEDNFRIGYLNDTQRQKFIENLMGYIAREFRGKTMTIFNRLYQKCFGKKPTVVICNKVMDDISNDEQPLGFKYSYEHIKEVFAKNILEIQEKLL